MMEVMVPAINISSSSFIIIPQYCVIVQMIDKKLKGYTV